MNTFKGAKYILIIGILLTQSVMLFGQNVKAYYTKLNSGAAWENSYRMGEHADIMVEIAPNEELYFWRASSYLPRWETNQGTNYIDQAPVTFSGDGTGLRWDEMCRHSHVRIISTSDSLAVIHWRYAPTFQTGAAPSIPGWTGWIDEYYAVRSDKTLTREIFIYDTKVKHTFEYSLNADGSLTKINNSSTAFDIPIPTYNSSILPSGPDLSFGATYTNLGYTGPYFQNDAPSIFWNENWQVGQHADIVVNFDETPKKWVFWRGAAYVPHMVSDNDIWYTNEFNENWNLNWDGGNSCQGAYAAEPMNDKPSIYGHVRLIENTPARVVVHYRYGMSNICNELAQTVDDNDGWRVFSDFYYYIYPDGITAQYNTIWSQLAGIDPHAFEWQESIVTNHPGTGRTDNLETGQEMIYGNLAGQFSTLDWSTLTQSTDTLVTGISNTSISKMNLKNTDLDPFTIVENHPDILYTAAVPLADYIHWPVNIHHSFGELGLNDIYTSHAATSNAYQWADYALGSNFASRVLLTGMENLNNTELARLANSWDNHANLTTVTGATNNGYNKAERAFILNASQSTIAFTINASAANPVHNPAFVIKNWNSQQAATLKVNGVTQTNIEEFKQGIFTDTDGTETLVIWVDMVSETPLNIEISEISAGTNICSGITPNEPSEVVVSIFECNVTLSWTQENCAAAYEVERSINGGSWTSLGIVNELNIIDNNINTGDDYAYRVKATNGANQSNYTTSNMVNCSNDCDWKVLSFDSFEHTLGTFNGDGADADDYVIEDVTFAKTGLQTAAITGDMDTEAISTKNIDLRHVDSLTIAFSFMTENMMQNENLVLEISYDGGSNYNQIQQWNYNTNFSNFQQYDEFIGIAANFMEQTRIRFRCNAADETHVIYLDDIVIQTCGGLKTLTTNTRNVIPQDDDMDLKFNLYPNPVHDNFTIEGALMNTQIYIINAQGSVIRTWNSSTDKMTVNVSELSNGFYFIHVINPQTAQKSTKKLIKID